MSSADKITDHDEIRAWAEERGGRPSRVKGTGGKSHDAGILRIDFGDEDEGLEEISWDEFFEAFEDRRLALLRQDETSGGKTSRFNKLVER
jgi:hypothetical protein